MLERTKRGVYQFICGCKHLMCWVSSRIAMNLFRGYLGNAEWLQKALTKWPDKEVAPKQTGKLKETPEEALGHATQQLHSALRIEVRDRFRDAEPDFIEPERGRKIDAVILFETLCESLDIASITLREILDGVGRLVPGSRGLAAVTRNTKEFRNTGVETVNPLIAGPR